MLTKVTAYSDWPGLDPLVMNVINRPETDLFEIRNIDGLGPVKADVNTTPMGSVDEESYTGSNIGKRNIVFTIGLDPDWQDWTASRLRRHLEQYFMPKKNVRMVFETMEFAPVQISGVVESNEPNMFSKDPEHVISVICPAPNFVSVDPITIVGTTADDGDAHPIDYQGSIETGFNVIVYQDAEVAHSLTIRSSHEYPGSDFFVVNMPLGLIDGSHYFAMSSVARAKWVRRYTSPAGTIQNILNYVNPGSQWPKLEPGAPRLFSVDSDAGTQNWSMTYYNRFRSL